MKLEKYTGRLKSLTLTRLAVRANVSVGDSFHAGPGSVLWAPRSLQVGNDVYVGKNVTIQVDGVIGDGVLFANGSGVVGRLDHDYRKIGLTVRESDWVGDKAELSLPVTVGSDVWIGFNSTIQSGLYIGNSAIIAAGSVVTKDVAENSIMAGVPARKIRDRFSSEELERHWEILAKRGIRRIPAPKDSD